MYMSPGNLGFYFFLWMMEMGLLLGMTLYWLSSMQRLMSACHPFSRVAEPGQVWLTLIPLFGLVWQFVAIKKVSVTVEREYARRGWHLTEKNPTMELGVVAGIVICVVSIIRICVPMHPALGFLGTLICCFLMWRHTEELISYRERPEKEMSQANTFVQTPYVDPNNPFAQYVNPYQQQNQSGNTNYPPPYSQYPPPQYSTNANYPPAYHNYPPQYNNTNYPPNYSQYPPPSQNSNPTNYPPTYQHNPFYPPTPQEPPPYFPKNANEEPKPDDFSKWAPKD